MADGDSSSIISEAVKWIASSGVGVAIGALAKGFFTGATGQEKEVREALSERLEKLEAKVDVLEKRLDAVTKNRDEWRWKCLEARALANDYARKAGEAAPVWVDPVEVQQT